MRLEAEFWAALEAVCRRERIEAGELVRRAEQGREGSTRTSAVRAYLLTYFRQKERAARGDPGGAAER